MSELQLPTEELKALSQQSLMKSMTVKNISSIISTRTQHLIQIFAQSDIQNSAEM
jgi:hypothetical protein